MKSTLFFIVSFLYTTFSFAQIDPSTPWTWMKGDNTVNRLGVYGTEGVGNTANKPGSRNSSTTWRDGAGNLWMFGGSGYASAGQGYLNDLWKFNPGTSIWTWVKGANTVNQKGVYGTQGVADVLNKPGASYSSASWTDASGNLWLFGGYGYCSTTMGLLNSLWKYNPTTNEWTWIKGDNAVNRIGNYGTQGVAAGTNMPGARYGSQTWTDASGNLWLFGGYGHASGSAGILNDMWKYNIATNEWTWVKGDNVINQVAVYGTKGVTNSSNKPGARYVSTSWKDQSGNFWMFGGYGYDETYGGNLNDMWKYEPATNQWTWMSGDKIIDQKAVFGTLGVPSISNKPGSRYIGSSWKDPNGDLLMFGGYGYDAINSGYLNDCWKYNIATNAWTWIKGDNTVDQPGIYGTQGMPDPNNKSGARTGSVSWSDGSGNLWMFGGYGFDGSSTGVLNDLWKINSSQLVLPLHLLNFSGTLNNDIVYLKWEAEQETGFSHYNVQRSIDGNNFITIGMVNGAGNNTRNEYTYYDNGLINQAAKKVFYRLQMMDLDGKFTYSKIICFDKEQTNGTITVFPNPASHSINISFEQYKKGNMTIHITGIGGNTIKTMTHYTAEGKTSLSIEVSTLPAGTYMLSVISENGTMHQKFIKQ